MEKNFMTHKNKTQKKDEDKKTIDNHEEVGQGKENMKEKFCKAKFT